MALLYELPNPHPNKTGWPWTEETPFLPPTAPNGSSWPKISIVTPSYNQGQFIEETIRSVLLQNYPNLEYIIMDGGSTDNSVEIIKKYEPWLTYWVSEKDDGQSDAINKGMKRANGEIAGWMNSDDLFLPNGIYSLVKASLDFPGAIAWVGVCLVVDADRNYINTCIPRFGNGKPSAFGEWSKETANFFQPACVFRMDKFISVGMLSVRFDIVIDVDLWMRFAKIGYFERIDTTVAEARHYPEIKSARDIPMLEVEHISMNFLMNEKEAAKRRLEHYTKKYDRQRILNMEMKFFALIVLTRIYREGKSLLNNSLGSLKKLIIGGKK